MTEYHVYFEPSAKSGQFATGRSVLEIARELNIGLNDVCGGAGSCGQCVIRVVEGKVSPVTEAERALLNTDRLPAGYRLACRTYITGDCRILIPTQSLSTLQRAQVEGMEFSLPPEPVIKTFTVRVPPPSLENTRADFERLQAAITAMEQTAPVTADIEVLRSLSPELRKNNRSVSAAIREIELISLRMGAKMALISARKRAEAQEIARCVHYVELAAVPRFSKIFAGSMKFGK